MPKNVWLRRLAHCRGRIRTLPYFALRIHVLNYSTHRVTATGAGILWSYTQVLVCVFIWCSKWHVLPGKMLPTLYRVRVPRFLHKRRVSGISCDNSVLMYRLEPRGSFANVLLLRAVERPWLSLLVSAMFSLLPSNSIWKHPINALYMRNCCYFSTDYNSFVQMAKSSNPWTVEEFIVNIVFCFKYISFSFDVKLSSLGNLSWSVWLEVWFWG